MSNHPPLLGGGAGSEISFSTLRDFYSDTNPVSLSEFTRGGSLVTSTFSGNSTTTSSTGAATKNDFGITQTTQTVYTGNPASTTTIRAQQTTNNSSTYITCTYTVQAGDSLITIGYGGTTDFGDDDDGNSNIQANGAHYISVNGGTAVARGPASLNYTGPAHRNSDWPALSGYVSSFSTGDVIVVYMTSPQQNNSSANVFVSTSRITASSEYDITFTNNNSTGDTYTLASNSSGFSLKSVYAAGESQLVRNDVTDNGWVIAYDRVTGSGSGTAGDIVVTVSSGSGGTKIITYRNSGSSSLTLTANSTGARRVIASGATTTVQSDGVTTNESWVVEFDSTSSGLDCNVGIPATISSGNPVNMDVFNTVTTPVG